MRRGKRGDLPRMKGVLVLGGALLVSCASPLTSERLRLSPETLQSTARFHKEYILAPDDQVEVVVQRSPEVSRTVTVRPDGFISLPLLGDVQAGGLTSRELGAKVTKLFSARLVAPEVTVIATRVRQPVVYVAGEVGTPSAVPLRDAPTALQAVALAGGFRHTAASRSVAVIRVTNDGYLQAIVVPTQLKGQPGPFMALRAVPLQADDMVFVPESGRGQFTRFVDDFVNKPLSGINSLFFTYLNFRLIEQWND